MRSVGAGGTHLARMGHGWHAHGHPVHRHTHGTRHVLIIRLWRAAGMLLVKRHRVLIRGGWLCSGGRWRLLVCKRNLA